MILGSIEPGGHYGYRKSRHLGAPVQHVEVLAKVKPGTWKVKFIDGPTAGMTDYVRTGRMVVLWSEAEAFLNDELRLLKVLEASEASSPDETVATAINAVLNASGDWDGGLSSYSDYVAQVGLKPLSGLPNARNSIQTLCSSPLSVSLIGTGI